MDADKPTGILSEFPAHTYDEWKAAAENLLKGRPFEKTLVTPTYEGFDVHPLYTREVLEKLTHVSDTPGEGSMVRGSRVDGYLATGWKVSQEITGPRVSDANAIALEYIAKGQTELNIYFDEATRTGCDADTGRCIQVCEGGVSLSTVEDFKTLLKGIDPGKTSLYLQGRQAAPSLYVLLMAALKEMSLDPMHIQGCLGMDPAGSLAETGTATSGFEDVMDWVAALMAHAEMEVPGLQVLDVQGHAYHNGGASSSQELAAVLASAVFYLRAMQNRGIAVEKVIRRMRISISIGGDYFIEISKLRALRLLWSRIMDAFQVPQELRGIHIHARTGLWNKTVLDPYVNLLRTTTEAFSAVVGGCDSLHIGPFDEVLRGSSDFSRRIAFNMHDILAEECDMRRVIDPAGGAWAVESLTDEMAKSTWKIFQDIEAEGGILKVLESGKFQRQVKSVRDQRLTNIQCRRDVIVGTNAYPNASEQLLPATDIDYRSIRRQLAAEVAACKNRRDNTILFTSMDERHADIGIARIRSMINSASKGATLAELQACAGLGTLLHKATPIPRQRAASEFEELRLAATRLEQAGRPPVIHQLNMGPSRRYRIRADWTSAFFQAGGFRMLNDRDFASVEAATDALQQSGARIAVITSDDETYGQVVGQLASRIRESCNPVSVYVAGVPGEHEAAWRSAGVDGFVNVRINSYEFNRQLLESLGASL